ncbi:MAG: 3'(2'),5'-bisphosphate nucleotidase CysQ [Holosporales bacterium]|jgi:3'(2'), 5'-bisphosphate nucleotidase|nr:3'(2'),5'-bisphosphate nucleotidase CysQ [Holosporales bacterium]
MREALTEIAKKAGAIIVAHHGETHWTAKADLSPVTAADQASHAYLSRALQDFASWPVVSEEGDPGYEVRKQYDQYWLIDPLDGTKGFIRGERDFCISIALMKGKVPVLGLIYAPLLEEWYYAEKGGKVFSSGSDVSEELPPRAKWRATVSRYHCSEATQHFLECNALKETLVVGSALKFCYLAVGRAEIYPRFEGSKEWDIAAGHLILEESGGTLCDVRTGRPPSYNKPSVENPFFVACRKGLRIEDFLLPESVCAG